MNTIDASTAPVNANAPKVHFQGAEFLLRGGGVLYGATMFSLVARVLITFLIAQALGAAGLGVYTLGFATVQALTMLALNGQDFGLVRFATPAFKAGDTATIRTTLHAALLTSTVFGLFVTVGMILVFPYFVLASTGSREAAALAPWFALAILPGVWGALLSALGLACGRISAIALPDRVIGTTVQLVVTFLALRFGWGLAGVLLAFVLNSAVSLIAMIGIVQNLYPRQPQVSNLIGTARTLLGYSWKIGLANAANYVLLNGALFVLGSLNAAQAGIYAAASRLTYPGLLFLTSFSQAFTPQAASKIGEPSLESDLQRVTNWMIVASAPVFVLLFAFAGTWMNLLGPDFSAGAPVLALLALAQMVNILTGASSVVIALANRPGLRVVNTVLAWGTKFVLVLLLAPQWGALGAAGAYFIAVLIIDSLEYGEARILLGISPWGRTLLKPALIIVALSGGLLIVAYWIHPALWGIVGLALGFLAAYIALMWFVGLPKADVEVLRSVLRGLLGRTERQIA